ncbi:alpha/beta fold hydrolase [Novosphingobium resinovorum]|uniref:alpha/beta hydrolase family protein n=1 Tax=Novosphingobium TaxID=165696 RepID=UPI001B3C6E68|nr:MULTISPECIES: alpha/beta fold hydrolase [Novosphingobium]WJM25989.1 alpha/beta fold hydrolase [Novosphingobium resinovorum]
MSGRNPVEIYAGGEKLAGTLLSPAKLIPGVLFIHGWGGSQEQDLARAEEIAQLGCICFTFDLRGHAGHDGKRDLVTRSDGLADVIAAYDFLASQEEVDPTAIAVVGTSYGGYLATLLTLHRSVAWLALRVPALYPDDHWDVPKALLPRAEIVTYRSHFRTGHHDKALAACEAFCGDVLIVESEYDDYVPHPAISSFMGAFQRTNSLSYRIMKGADHALRNEACRKAYNDLLLTWIEEMVRGGRRTAV